jgi:phosphoribosylglycinamide formyltransferase-1
MSGTTECAPLRLAVLLSGGGRTLANLLERIAAGSLSARVVVAVSSRAGARGADVAREAGVPAFVVPRAEFPDGRAFSEAVNQVMAPFAPEAVALAGFLSLYTPPPDLAGRVLNIHPALLPAFGGKGMYGARVHQAVLDWGVKVTGCTVHFADTEYDQGPIVVQKTVAVQEDDTAESLAARVFALECEAYPEAIQLLAEGRLRVEGRRVRVLP